MAEFDNYLTLNRTAWNEKTSLHADSEFYGMSSFLAGNTTLNPIELRMMGDITGKKILHLQCHFGQDTISLARMGATVTGVDFSDKAIDLARQLAAKTGKDVRFICSDVYSLPDHHAEKYDMIFTTYGVLGWLPDMDRWAAVVSNLLKPGGELVLVEFHPVIWMFDDRFSKVIYSYFDQGPIQETEKGSYADREAAVEITTVGWNHSLSEVLGGLLHHHMEIVAFEEYDYSPYNCLHDMTEDAPGQFRVREMGSKLPHVYAVKARKKG